MFQNPVQMVQQFNQFVNTFKGNPKTEVEKMVQSGQISQAQLNQIQGMVSEFQKILKTAHL